MNDLRGLRVLSWLEGASLLLLVLVAMPLKYVWGMPSAVRVVGSAHGLLFLGFCLALLRTSLERRWALGRALKLLVLSILPGGVFGIERALKRNGA
jgi:integral membrane protein